MATTDGQRKKGLLAKLLGGLGLKGPDRSPVGLEYQPDAVEIEETPLPGSARWSLYLLLAMVVIGVIWASISEVDRVVVARGKMVTTAPSIVVQPMDTSIIMDIKVLVGQVVDKNEVLAVLDPTFTQADLASIQTRLRSFNAQIRRLEAEANEQTYRVQDQKDEEEQAQLSLYQKRRANFTARITALRETLSRLEAELNTNQRVQKVLAERLRGLTQMENMRVSMYEARHESKLKVLEAQNQRLEVERDLSQANNREAEIRHELAKSKAEMEAFAQSWRQDVGEELIKARRERDYSNEQLSKAQRRGDLVTLRSPAKAMVLEMAKRSVGSVVREAEPLFTLVPLDAGQEAEVQIEARDIGYVRPGDQARLKIDAFPFQKHGAARAQVRSISEDVVQQPYVSEGGEEKKGGLYYIGRLAVTDLKLNAVPSDFRLLPGMTLTAEIKIGERKVISYLLYPVIRGFDESLREP